jgi:hypothetical protein
MVCHVFLVARHTVLGVIGLFLCSCVAAPVEESRAFSNAAITVKSAGDLLFDQLAAAERRSYKASAKKNARRAYVFDVADAPYFSTIGEPPEVAAFRNSLDVVKNYAALLVSLAEGQDLEKSKSQLLGIASNVATLAQFTQFAPVVALITPIIDQALRASSIAEARRIAIDGAPSVRTLIRLLRDASPLIFKALSGDLLANGADSTQFDAKRVVIANFVMLLDSLAQVFDRLVAAYDRPSSPASLAALLEFTANLNADVTAARKAFAEIGR